MNYKFFSLCQILTIVISFQLAPVFCNELTPESKPSSGFRTEPKQKQIPDFLMNLTRTHAKNGLYPMECQWHNLKLIYTYFIKFEIRFI